jgi:hypothetical protein
MRIGLQGGCLPRRSRNRCSPRRRRRLGHLGWAGWQRVILEDRNSLEIVAAVAAVAARGVREWRGVGISRRRVRVRRAARRRRLHRHAFTSAVQMQPCAVVSLHLTPRRPRLIQHFLQLRPGAQQFGSEKDDCAADLKEVFAILRRCSGNAPYVALRRHGAIESRRKNLAISHR